MSVSPSTRQGLSPSAMVLLKAGEALLVRLRPPPPWMANETPQPLSLHELQILVSLREGKTSILGATDAPGRRLLERLDLYGILNGSTVDTAAEVTPSRSGSSPSSVSTIPDVPLVLPAVVCLGVIAGGFEAVNHEGTSALHLAPDEVSAALAFGNHRTVPEAYEEQTQRLAERALSNERFESLVARLIQHKLLVKHDPAQMHSGAARDEAFGRVLRANAAFRDLANKRHRDHDAREVERTAGSRPRARVVLVHTTGTIPPLSLGMILAHAQQVDGGALNETYDLNPRWITDIADAPAPNGAPVIYFFSDYLWSHEANLKFCSQIKAADPGAVTIHGGPDCPSSASEAEVYLNRHPHVDVAVRGEGEVTASEILAALAPSIRAGHADYQALEDVPGLTFRLGDRIVRSADRPRMDDINKVPSPYLSGVFDDFGTPRLIDIAIIETNRGCPYGCTFCDWGSATNSRLRRFDLDRVLTELTWCAEHSVQMVFCADANFGIFPRDVDIARHIVDLKQRYGFPKRFVTNYAKNSVKHLKDIVMLLAKGGVITEGLISLQSMDEGTLAAVKRSNIRLDKYEELATEFRRARMPLFVDLMMGLPGQTVASLRHDLQQCVDREVSAKCHATELLVNSPMNDPDYRREHQLESSRPPGAGNLVEAGEMRPEALVISSSTFSRDDYCEMQMMRRAFLLCENLGAMRHILRFLRAATGLKEVTILEDARALATRAPAQWPYLALALNAVPDTLAPPVSWGRFIADVRRYATGVMQIHADSALETALAVQLALIPAPGRTFPVELDLAHDYAAWHRDVMSAKDSGRLEDWETVIKPLADYPPARMTINDPHRLCERALGFGSALDAYLDWEFESPVARAMPAHYQL